MDPADFTWLDLVADKSGPLGVLGVFALAAWQAWLKFGQKKDSTPAPNPAVIAPTPAPVDAEARDRLTLLEHQMATVNGELDRVRELQQQDHDAIVSVGPKLEGMRDALVSLRDDARGKQ